MRHPSIRLRLLLGAGSLVTLALVAGSVTTYRGIKRTLEKEVRQQLRQSASLLAKSAELEPEGVVYEWNEAMQMPYHANVTGLFEFWDLKSGHSLSSPDLKGASLPQFHGELNEQVVRSITLPDGTPAQAIGLLHLPFLDDDGLEEMKEKGSILDPRDYPQVVVIARETRSTEARLLRIRTHLLRSGGGTLIALWISIMLISRWSLYPLRGFTESIMKRSTEEGTPAPEIPPNLPVELTGLARAFNAALARVESARHRERDFARHAAHELRTPIAGVQATLEQAIHRPRSSEDLTERIGEALQLVGGIRTTLNGLMRLARLRGGLEAVSVSPFDPVAILLETIEHSRPAILEKALVLEVPDEEARPAGPLTSDPGLFRVLVTNLVENAVRYTPAGGSLWLHVDDAADHFAFSLRNDRGALDPRDHERLFEPFQRGSDAADDEGGHAGLGLSLCREIAKLLGATLSMEFEDERTVTFLFRIGR